MNESNHSVDAGRQKRNKKKQKAIEKAAKKQLKQERAQAKKSGATSGHSKVRKVKGSGVKKSATVTRPKGRLRLNRDSFSNSMTNIVMNFDYQVVILVTMLVIFGVIMVFSAGYYSTLSTENADPYYFLKRQGVFAIIGFGIMYLLMKLDYHWYAKYYRLIAVISILLLLALIPFGVTVNFAKRWLMLGPIRITPSEISKLAMIIFTSAWIAEDPKRPREPVSGVLPVIVIMLFQAGLIVKQPNLSTAIVICANMMGIMFVGGLPKWYFGLAAGFGGLGTFYIMTFKKHSHWYSRITTFLDPFKDAQGEGYQVTQSIIALGNGGLKGLGLGNSIAKNLYLPEPQNDFILAIIGEELGFIGFFALMVVYLYLVYRGLLISAHAKDKLGMFMAAGITIMLALQVIINVAVVTSSMPATGITLPFVSYGGTSLWVFMGAMGILLNISKKEG